MAMREVWTSTDAVDGSDWDVFNDAGSLDPPLVWCDPVGNEYSPYTINILVVNDDLSDHVWRRYRLDGRDGRLLSDELLDDPSPIMAPGWVDPENGPNNLIDPDDFGRDGWAADAGGNTWTWLRGGTFAIAQLLNYTDADGELRAGFSGWGEQFLPTDFGRGGGDSPRVFGIDARADRIFASWNADSSSDQDVRRLYVYKLSDFSLVATLRLPSKITQVCTDPNGFLWVADQFNWLRRFTYDGRFLGAWQQTGYPRWVANSNATIPYARWAWDPFADRLLLLPLDYADRASLNLKAFAPSTVEALLSEPIPLRKPLRYRSTTFLSKLSGSGGEAAASRRVDISNATTGQAATDKDGDVTATYTPSATGSATLTFTVP